MGRAANRGKLFRFLRNKSEATAHNVYQLRYPTGPLKAALARDPSLYQRLFDMLRSLDTDRIKADGRVYGGGLFKMEPRELAKIPADFLPEALGLPEIAALGRQGTLFE